MHDHLSEQGIELVRSAPNTAEQIGVAKRANRTLMKVVMSVLSHAGPPTSFWGESRAYTTDISSSNESGRNAIKSLNELLSSMVPDIGHLWTFGCHFMVHVSQQLQKNLRTAVVKEYYYEVYHIQL